MVTRWVAVFMTNDAWVIGGLQAGEPVTERVPRTTQDAEHTQLRRWLEANVKETPNVVLGVSSEDCFCAAVSSQGLPRLGRARGSAMRYRLEAKLPVDVDALTVRWLTINSDSLLSVATETAVWQDARRLLAECGVVVSNVVPTALLLVDRAEGGAALVQTESDGVDLLTRHPDGALTEWRYVSAESPDLSDAVLGSLGAGPLRVIGLPPEGVPETETVSSEPDAFAALTTAAAAGLDRPNELLVRFEESADERAAVWRRWRPVAVAAMLLIWLVAGALHLRAGRYQDRTDQVQVSLRDAYAQQYPGEAVPAVILPRLRSLAQGLSSGETGAEGMDVLPEAIGLWEVLHPETLSPDTAETQAVAPANPVRVREFTLTASTFQLGGVADSLGALDTAATRLSEAPAVRQRGGLEPAATQVLPSGELGYSLRSRSAAAGGAR